MAEHSPQPNVSGLDLSARFWLLLLLTGLGSGLAGGAMMQLLYLVEHSAWSYHRPEVFLQAVSRASPRRILVNLALAGALVGVAAAVFRRFFGHAGGDADGAIWFRSGRIEFLPAVCRALVSIVSVGMGTSLGRESPIKQTGGAIASQLAKWAGVSPAQMQLLAACGVGAGMAAAYNVPLGGALFAAEVLLGSMLLRTVVPTLVVSVVATAASWVFLPIEPIYKVPEFPVSLSLVVWSIPAGPLLGLAAVIVVRGIAWAEARKPQGAWAVASPILVLSSLGALAIAFPQLLGNGKDTVQLAFTDSIAPALLFSLPILKLLATVGCLRSGATGGLFTPTMTVGALLGGAFGYLWSFIWPVAAAGSYAEVGACAVLAAATQGPVSALVLTLEMTRHADATMVPMLLAVCGATIVARRLELRSIYSARAMHG